MKNKTGLLLIFIGVFFASCTSSSVFEKSVSFKNQTWSLGDEVVFEVELQDTSKLYDFVLTLRTTTDYKYSNLWIFWETSPPKGETVREPFEFKITQPNGAWIGKKSGTVIENNIHFGRRKIPQRGKYTFKLEQGINQEKIDEVLDITLTVNEVKN